MSTVCFRRSLLEPHKKVLLECVHYDDDGVPHFSVFIGPIYKDKNGEEFIEVDCKPVYLNRNIQQSSTQFYILDFETFQKVHEGGL